MFPIIPFHVPLRPHRSHGLTRFLVAWVMVGTVACTGMLAHAQSEPAGTGLLEEGESDEVSLSDGDARQLLAQALPEGREARYAVLQRQAQAALRLGDRPRLIELSRQLMEIGRGLPGGEVWIVNYLNAEFTWGSSGLAMESSEGFVNDNSLSLNTRATVALRQTFFAAQGRERSVLSRVWSRADKLSTQALQQAEAAPGLAVARLQGRSEYERWMGNREAAIGSLREAVRLAKQDWTAISERNGNRQDSETQRAYSSLDGSLGMLTYALVRQGRAQEAIQVAQGNVALWRAGKISDGVGARWNYRLATGLNAVQQFEAALVAARQSDEMLQRAGSAVASHTRWLARQELVRALIGLERWKEADASYREFLATMPNDMLARTRASDTRLLALLAAKNGRFDEALQPVERSIRYRTRLYGANHPDTQEMVGLRAVIKMLRGDVAGALPDYEVLFKATLDTPGGWLDLDVRGVRGYVFGIAFQEFMRYCAGRAANGQPLDVALSDRALQIADRNAVGVTQRALTDSTARVLAASPELREMLELEQAQRRAESDLAAQLNPVLAQEDQLRRDMQTDAFKALEPDQRKPTEDQLKQVRDQIKALQTSLQTARSRLTGQREAIAKRFPAYADLVTPTLPRRQQLRALLAPGEAMLVMHPGEKNTLVWLIAANGQDAFSASALGAAELHKRVVELRSMLDLGALPVGHEPALQTERLYALYRDLLGPLQKPLSDVKSLLVTTNGVLASLPFAALVLQPPTAGSQPDWLVRHMAVTQLPSASALLALRRVAQPKVATKALIGFGDPLFKADPGRTGQPKNGFSGRLLAQKPSNEAGRYDAESGFRYADIAPLPETRKELLAVASSLGADPQRDLLMGSQATRRAVLETPMADRRVLAFATHGLMPGDLPGVSKPALAMAASTDEGESPLLELDDVLGLRLNAQWVLLSACNTAAGVQNDYAMTGLVRGFFFAGTRSVLATHWAVESESAAALSSATFANTARSGTPRGESLRQAQLAMLDGSLGGGQWKHPYYWAAYALFGDPLR